MEMAASTCRPETRNYVAVNTPCGIIFLVAGVAWRGHWYWRRVRLALACGGVQAEK